MGSHHRLPIYYRKALQKSYLQGFSLFRLLTDVSQDSTIYIEDMTIHCV